MEKLRWMRGGSGVADGGGERGHTHSKGDSIGVTTASAFRLRVSVLDTRPSVSLLCGGYGVWRGKSYESGAGEVTGRVTWVTREGGRLIYPINCVNRWEGETR